MANEVTAPASAKPATGAAKTNGNGTPKDVSSLIGDALKGKSADEMLEIMAEVEDGVTAAQVAKPVPEPEPEPVVDLDPEPTKEELSVEIAETTPEPVKPEDEEHGEVEFNDKGNKVTLRRARFDKMLTSEGRAKAAEEQLLKVVTAIQERASKPADETPTDAKLTPTVVDVRDAIIKRMTEAKEKINQAKDAFDKDAEMAAFDEFIDAKADLKVLESETRSYDRTEQANQEVQMRQWVGQLVESEKAHKALRNQQFAEDCVRYPDLLDKGSELHKQAFAIQNFWKMQGLKVALAPDCERLALEQAVRELGLQQSTSAVTPTPVVQPKTGIRPNGPKPTGAVIQGATPTGKPRVTTDELKAKIGQLSKRDADAVMLAIMEKMG